MHRCLSEITTYFLLKVHNWNGSYIQPCCYFVSYVSYLNVFTQKSMQNVKYWQRKDCFAKDLLLFFFVFSQCWVVKCWNELLEGHVIWRTSFCEHCSNLSYFFINHFPGCRHWHVTVLPLYKWVEIMFGRELLCGYVVPWSVLLPWHLSVVFYHS